MRLTRVLIPVLFSFAVAIGQPLVTKVTIPAATERTPLSVSVELTSSTDIQRVTLWYRNFGESDFRELEMLLAGRTATLTLPSEIVRPPYIEYYIRLTRTNNLFETYPVEGPEINPLKIQVAQANPKDSEVRILSPEPGETITAEDLVVAVSLYYASPAVNAAGTKIYLDGADVTAAAVRSDDVLLYSPRSSGRPMNLGSHFLKVELYDTTGQLYHSMSETFNLSTQTAIEEQKARLQVNGNGQLEVRNEALAIGTTTYVRGDTRVDGTYQSTNFGASIHLDNQNKDDRQPQNRFLLYGETGFLRLQLGDAFPRFPSNIISGARVRGITGNLALGFFNLDVTYGQSVRFIEGRRAARDTVFADSSSVYARPANTIRTGDFFTYNIFTSGTYSRRIFAVRPSFGSGEHFQIGFTYMKAIDDTTSIGLGTDPNENLIVGTDFLVAADDQRIRLDVQGSMSVMNKNILGGSFTQAQYDSLKARDEQMGSDLEQLGKIADKFITINENVFPTNPVSKGLPGLAAEAALTANYFNNYVRGVFFHRGAGYKSLGNEYLQTDLQGFQVSDNIRLFQNRMFASVSYERKADNTAATKEITTTYSNLNTSLSVIPGLGYPNFQIGFGRYGRSGPVDLMTRLSLVNRPDSASVQMSSDEATSRYYIAGSYDISGKIRHTVSASFSLANREDATFRRQNQQNIYVQGGVTSAFGRGLQTTVSVIYSGNRNEGEAFYRTAPLLNRDSIMTVTKYNYTMVSLGAQYSMLNDNLRLSAGIIPAFGIFNRQEYLAGAEYSFAQRHTLLFQGDYIQNSGANDDTILSLIYRINF